MGRNCSTLFSILLIGTLSYANDRNLSISGESIGTGNPWQWTLYITGDSGAIAHIRCVEYTLDATFSNPVRTICERGTGDRPFSSSGTTWGSFGLSATITLDDGSKQQVRYFLIPSLTYQHKGWHPIDMAFNPYSGLFVLDQNGKVSNITIDQNGIHVEALAFNIPGAFSPIAIAASKDSVFVSSFSSLGCMVFRYSITAKTVEQKSFGGRGNGCDGITTDGRGLFLVLPRRHEIWYWADYNSATNSNYRSWDWPDQTSFEGGALDFNSSCNCLTFANQKGSAYSLSIENGKWKALTSSLGYVQSVSSDSDRVLFASGKKVFFYSRTNNRVENPPPGMKSLTGGLISGVALDNARSAAWVSDYDNGMIKLIALN